MTSLIEIGLSNVVAALMLALLALVVGFTRVRPAVVHALWLLVLLKLITPPLVRLPIPWPTPSQSESLSAVQLEEPISLELEDEEWWFDEAELVDAHSLLVEEDSTSLRLDAVKSRQREISSSSTAWSLKERLGGIWLTGSVAWFSIAGYRLWCFGWLLRLGKPAHSSLLRRVQRLAKRVELCYMPHVCVIPGRLAPLIWSIGRPRLILPEGLEEQVGSEGLDTLLLHELSHLKRGDHWIRWLEFVVLGLYWWLPVAWYARRELREAEEQCCDAWVVRSMPEARRLYAAALVEALDFLSQPVSATPPLASALGQVADLKRRLVLIMRGTTPHTLGRPASLAMFGLACFLLPLVPRWSQAQVVEVEVEQNEKRVEKREREDDALREEIRRSKEEIAALARKLVERQRVETERNRDREIEEIQNEIRRRKVEIENLSKKLAERARDSAEAVRKKVEEKRILVPPDRRTTIIEIDGELKGEMVEEIVKLIKQRLPEGNRKVSVRPGSTPMLGIIYRDDKDKKTVISPKPAYIQRDGKWIEIYLQPGEVIRPVRPEDPSRTPPTPPRAQEARRGEPAASPLPSPGLSGPGPRQEERLQKLERNLETVLRELEMMRREMRGRDKEDGKPSRRQER